jgi:prepilin-type N-terminal cleavage/methylation domain-containing protein
MKYRGFTIVELLIVIVVIAILASISVVAYNGIQNRAETTSRLAEIKSWEQAFKLYRAENGEWPPGLVPGNNNNFYCLGDQFPIGNDGQRRCRDLGNANSYLQSKSTASGGLLDQLKPYSVVPSKAPKALAGVTGPWAQIYNDSTSTLEISNVFPTVCPSGFLQDGPYSGVWYCQLRIAP